MVIPKKHAESYVDIFDSIYDILQHEADYLPCSMQRIKDGLLNNVDPDEVKMWFRILKGDVGDVIESLNEILSVVEDVEMDIAYYEEHHADQ